MRRDGLTPLASVQSQSLAVENMSNKMNNPISTLTKLLKHPEKRLKVSGVDRRAVEGWIGRARRCRIEGRGSSSGSWSGCAGIRFGEEGKVRAVLCCRDHSTGKGEGLRSGSVRGRFVVAGMRFWLGKGLATEGTESDGW